MQIYSTISKIEAWIVGRKTRSMIRFPHFFMEGYKSENMPKLAQFVTGLNSGNKHSIDLITKNVETSDLLANLYSKPLRVYRKPKFTTRQCTSFSRTDLHPTESYKRKIKLPKKKTIEDEEDENLSGKFYRKALFRAIWQWNRLQKSWLLWIPHSCFQTKHSDLLQTFWRNQKNHERQHEIKISAKTSPSLFQNDTEGKFVDFDIKKFKIISVLPHGALSLPIQYCWIHEHVHSREKQSQPNENCNSLCEGRTWCCFFYGFGKKFGKSVGNT